MKNCRFCYSEINRRARVCPVCQNTLSLFGTIKSFLVTTFPILTALVSLGFAYSERYEKGVVQDTLTATEGQLQVVEVQNDVAREAVANLIQDKPRVTSSAPFDIIPTNGEPVKTADQQIREIEEAISGLTTDGTLNLQKLRALEQKRLNLQFDRPIFEIRK
jgi:hypothetical protein